MRAVAVASLGLFLSLCIPGGYLQGPKYDHMVAMLYQSGQMSALDHIHRYYPITSLSLLHDELVAQAHKHACISRIFHADSPLAIPATWALAFITK